MLCNLSVFQLDVLSRSRPVHLPDMVTIVIKFSNFKNKKKTSTVGITVRAQNNDKSN